MLPQSQNAPDEVGAAYVQLALRIEQHLPGYIDAYFGPPEWKASAAAAGKLPLDALQSQLEELTSAAQIARLDAQRRRFLSKQLCAMQTTLRLLAQEPVPYVEEVQGLYDLTPQRIDDAVFDEALRQIDALLPGAGSINERMRARRKRFAIPPARAAEVFARALAEVRRRTAALFTLPADESVELSFVKDKPWSAYNWYLGSARSLIEVNTDTPLHANSVLGLMAHEGYPGHHSEHAIKEQEIYARKGWLEGCALLINAPECVISEGIASTALDIIFEPAEAEQWQREELYPRAEVSDDLSPDDALRLQTATHALGGVAGNAALMLHVDGSSRDDVIDYLMRYSSRTRGEAERNIRFMTDPVFRSYIFTYDYGHAILTKLFARFGKQRVFERVLVEPLTPTDLRAWLSA